MSDEQTPVAPAVRPLTFREKLISKQRKQGHKVHLVSQVMDGEKMEVEVRCPSMALRQQLAKQYKDDAAKQDVAVVVACTYEPGELQADGTRLPGTKLVYEPADMAVLMGPDEPTGGWVDRLSMAIGKLIKDEINNAQDGAKN